jgi:hypothetical protein
MPGESITKGIKFIRTAQNYAEGYAEILVGKAIKPYKRESLFIASCVNELEFTKKEEQIKTESNKIVATLQVTIEKQKSQIDELIKKEQVVSINPKAVGTEVGIASDLMYRFGANYNFLGPIYIGVQVDSDFKAKVRPGVTIGVRF